jgi:hypothetical protein
MPFGRMVRAMFFAAVLTQFGFAQMGGGMGGGIGGGPGSGIGVGTGRGITGGLSTAMGNVMTGVVVGPDGTAYLLRANGSYTASAGSGSVSNDLIAVNPQTGRANWKVSIGGSMMSQLVLSSGQIYLTTSALPMYDENATNQSAFVIVSSATGAVVNRVNIAGDLLSAPVVSPDGQTIYVMAVDMTGFNTAGVSGSTTLYAFSPSGAVKFHVPLAQL